MCLKEGNFKEAPTFKIRFGKLDKTINTYYIASDKQRYNYDILLEKDKENEILIEVLMTKMFLNFSHNHCHKFFKRLFEHLFLSLNSTLGENFYLCLEVFMSCK